MAIFGLMSVRWSPSVSVTSQSLRVVLLDVDQLGLGGVADRRERSFGRSQDAAVVSWIFG